MDKISLELFENILKECNKKLDDTSLSREQKDLYLKTSKIVSDIVLDDVETKK